MDFSVPGNSEQRSHSRSRPGNGRRLRRLSLAGSKVTDDGLKPLHGLTGWQELDLTGTKVTAAGVAALQKALPKCKIVWDGKQ